jgi:hypothetical protein
VQRFGKSDRADLSKTVPARAVEGLQKREFTKTAATPATKRRQKSVSERLIVVPKNCQINVTDNRIDEIYVELRTLKLADARNAIAVLMRVFLELSVDHFLEANGSSLDFKLPNGQRRWKDLDKKLSETVDILVKRGVPRAHFQAVIRSVSDKNSPMHMELFHRYVHDRFQTPVTSDLIAAWNNAQPLFEKIWP